MAATWKLDHLNRALDLISAPLVLEILDGLGHGKTPDDVAPTGTDPATIHAAVEHLQQVGAVTTGDREHTPSLTAKGRRLLDVFERFGGPPPA